MREEWEVGQRIANRFCGSKGFVLLVLSFSSSLLVFCYLHTIGCQTIFHPQTQTKARNEKCTDREIRWEGKEDVSNFPSRSGINTREAKEKGLPVGIRRSKVAHNSGKRAAHTHTHSPQTREMRKGGEDAAHNEEE